MAGFDYRLVEATEYCDLNLNAGITCMSVGAVRADR